MSRSTIHTAMLRIAAATVTSPISVYATSNPEVVDAVFGAVVFNRKRRENDQYYIGSYSMTDEPGGVRKEITARAKELAAPPRFTTASAA